jgi:hypothetical protein
MVHNLVRVPLSIITYVLTQSSTRPVDDLNAKLSETGFRILLEERNRLGNFALLVAERREA